jgi:pimeloyl-ACP methyl ester carboxylesterase
MAQDKEKTQDSRPATVVLIHGIWMTGVDMSLLRYRLRRFGFTTRQFSYPTVRCDLQQNAKRLQHFVADIEADTIHYVAHSLGGLLVRQFFHDFPQQLPGRVVTLGTPHQGSQVARALENKRWGHFLLGKSLHHGLLGDVPPWTSAHEIGVIAGRIPLGVGALVSRLRGPNDGTVLVSETPLNGMADYKVLPVTHMGMMLVSSVAREINSFLTTGKFLC